MKNRPALLIVALGAALLSLPVVQAKEVPAGGPGEGRREMRREKMGERMGERMAEELGLTAEQQAKIKELNQAERSELKALRSQSVALKNEQRAKFAAIHKSYMEKRQTLMTPEQREKAKQMRANMEKRREHREMHREMSHEKPADKK